MPRPIDRGWQGKTTTLFRVLRETIEACPAEKVGSIGAFRRWLRGVPWRHLWILVALVLLLSFALFGWFPRH